MSQFTASNIIPDDESDEDIDNTKEVQIEEALKLYQGALKLHALGWSSYKDAFQAYDALFQSEIFRYPESLPYAQQAELWDSEYALTQLADLVDTRATTTGLDGAPSTLPQILYLSYKNYGQFVLDYLKHHLAQHHEEETGQDLGLSTPQKAAANALNSFAEALVKDDTDAELWRRTARVGAALGSGRIARFCLEAVLDVGAGINGDVDPLGLQEALAHEPLTKLLDRLEDHVSRSQSSSTRDRRQVLAPRLRKCLDPYPYLPHSWNDEPPSIRPRASSPAPTRHAIDVPAKTWAAVGKVLLQQLVAQHQGLLDLGAGAGVLLRCADATWEHEPEAAPPPSEAVLPPGSHPPAPAASSGSTMSRGTTEDPAKEVSTGSDVDQLMAEAEAEAEDGRREAAPARNGSPSRKRNLSTAGLQEGNDGGRVRSKRIRARESVVDPTQGEDRTGTDLARQYDEQTQVYMEADGWLFQVVNTMLALVGGDPIGSVEELKQSRSERGAPPDVAVTDLYTMVSEWSDDKLHLVLHGGILAFPASTEPSRSRPHSSRKAGLTAFLEHSKRSMHRHSTKPLLSGDEGLDALAREVNHEWLSIKAAATRWLHALFSRRPNIFPGASEPSYLCHVWPDALKEVVVQMLVVLDEHLYEAMRKESLAFQSEALTSGDDVDVEVIEFVETVFELHLDVLERINNPSSEVDVVTRLAQQDRLDRWATLIEDLMSLRCPRPDEVEDALDLRFLWASVSHATLSVNVSREHIMLCVTDVAQIIRTAGDAVIELPNNAAMPEVSSAAAEKVLTGLSTVDFYLRIFQPEEVDPWLVIETLEPVLNPPKMRSSSRASSPSLPSISPSRGASSDGSRQTEAMTNFLQGGSTSLRLFMWTTLEEAYDSIGYPPQVLTCLLRSIEIIMGELQSPAHIELPPLQRQASLATWLHTMDGMMTQALSIGLDEPSAMDCMDETLLAASLGTVAALARLLHTYSLFDDAVRIEQVALPRRAEERSPTSYGRVSARFRDMQLRAWTLLYVLCKEGVAQHRDCVRTENDHLLEYLRAVHQVTGLRGCCQASNKVLLQLMKRELLQASAGSGWEADLVQVLFDLHGLRLGSQQHGLQEHGCTPSALDRATAVQIMDFVMMLVKRVELKDLPKTEYKAAMEKMQQAIGAPKQTSAMLHNMRNFAAFSKAAIHPTQLYQCLRGQCQLSAVPVPAESAAIAEKGWYVLLGQMSLVRFRSQKRVSQGPADDLDLASYFFRLDLQYSMDRWETWYRQAQVYDSRIDDDVMWSADTLNTDLAELHTLQRNAIHCYTMAVSTAVRMADASPATARELAQLYSDFGTRIYASSRPPFSMGAYSVADFPRHFSGTTSMYQKPAHPALSEFQAWRFASVLFQQALEGRAESWKDHYMLGKCLWKMYRHWKLTQPTSSSVLVQIGDVLHVLIRAIETIPERRSERQEPILEPHYKLVSVIHKLVKSWQLEPFEAISLLEATPYSSKVPSTEDRGEWDAYVLQILKVLRSADKSNWHHRMTARAAHIIYDGARDDTAAAASAKHELSQQIFTKTMAVQVWKPEHERAGRHFVYTSAYVSFFTRLLALLDDRASMEALAKRVRKKPSDFFQHEQLWERVCQAYLQMLRRAGQIPESHEPLVFKAVLHDDFQKHAARLESWCYLPTTSSPVLDVLRDVVELKKLNSGLLLVFIFDELAADAYARLYETVVPTLMLEGDGEDAPVVPKKEERHDPMSVSSLLMSPDGPSERPLTASDGAAPGGAKGRIKMVSRREVLRKAEMAVARPVPTVPVPSKSARTTEAPRVATPTQPSMAEAMEELPPPREESKDEAGPMEVQASSELGSLHDSADDESGDAESDDEAHPPNLLFPNLGVASTSRLSPTEEGS
ncbi:MAG: Histone transcription regulator 3 [Thelocarpon superellum]|nr:MAG: Histone transcription regulator 3 [Thelocarpon superellum]